MNYKKDTVKAMRRTRDFTLQVYTTLLKNLLDAGYTSQTFRQYLQSPAQKVVILRHDVDKLPLNSLRFASVEKSFGMQASYFFRVVPEVLKPSIIKAISGMGHEIGYHYEDMDPAKGDISKAIITFQKNLALLRNFADIDTICMHGSPLSKFDNKELWHSFDYRDYGIIGEPYFDLDYSKVFYITDTGRKWNNKESSIRDKVASTYDIKVNSTQHFIELLKKDILPDQMMINTHPQRWDDNLIPWVKELVLQSAKNTIKGFVSRRSN